MTADFPPPLGELKETFEYLEEWDERYEYIIELGKSLPGLAAEIQTEENRVHGCMSTVWLVAEANPENNEFQISADSNSLIVKGLIAILLAAFAGKTAADVLAYEVDDLFSELGLNQHLSANRRNGLFSMVKRVKELALQSTQ